MPATRLGAQIQPMGDTGVETVQVDWGVMTASSTRFPAGFDGAEFLRALGVEGLCPVPHWGYVISGSVIVRYTDGREETARAGDLFYLPPGLPPSSWRRSQRSLSRINKRRRGCVPRRPHVREKQGDRSSNP